MAGYVEFWALKECLYDDEGYSVEDAPPIGPIFYSVEELTKYMTDNNLEHAVNCVVSSGLTFKK